MAAAIVCIQQQYSEGGAQGDASRSPRSQVGRRHGVDDVGFLVVVVVVG